MGDVFMVKRVRGWKHRGAANPFTVSGRRRTARRPDGEITAALIRFP